MTKKLPSSAALQTALEIVKAWGKLGGDRSNAKRDQATRQAIGRKGGLAAQSKRTKEQRQAAARHAAQARWQNTTKTTT